MTHWLVRLTGDEADLAMLAEFDHSADWRITRRDGGFVLTTNWLDSESSAERVVEKARELVRLLSGASMALLGTPQPFVVSSLSRVRDDGHEDQYLFPEPAVATARAFPGTIIMTRPDGTSDTHRPTDPLREWLPLAIGNQVAARVLRLRARGPLDWDDLLRVIEVIQSSGIPLSAIANAPSQTALDTLTHTASSVHVLGDESRHPGRDYAPPAEPMSLPDARALVDRLINAWFAKLASQIGGAA